MRSTESKEDLISAGFGKNRLVTRNQFYIEREKQKMKKILLLLVVIGLIGIYPLTAGGKQEEPPTALEPMTLNVGVLKGPSGFGAIGMMEETSSLGQGVTAEFQVLPSPVEMIARLSTGEIQAGLLPMNTAAKLYSQGGGFPLAAVPGLGSLYILSRDPGIKTWKDLEGKMVYAIGKGATPDYLLQYYLKAHGVEASAVTVDYSIPAPQLAQMASAGKADTLLLTQPFVALVQKQAPDMKIALDFQEAWRTLQGAAEAYPITAFVVDPVWARERPEAFRVLMDSYRQSIDWVLAHPDEAAGLIEKYGILAAGPARMALPDCGLAFFTALEAREEVTGFLKVLMELDPVSVGGKLPDEGFFLVP
jgi:NitT/TauT family transport system substrate-binding protein